MGLLQLFRSRTAKTVSHRKPNSRRLEVEEFESRLLLSVNPITDYNGDGRSDIAFHRPGSTWATAPVLLANGNGSWNATNPGVPAWANQPGVVALSGDYNNDGNTDIAFHRPGSTWNTVPVLFANGSGGWTSSNFAAPSWANQPGVVGLTGDFNNDGNTDIAFHRPGSTWNTVPVLFANGSGGWTDTNFAAPSWANQPGVIALTGDYNRDGLTDIAFHRPGSTWNTVPVLFANGSGGWTDTNLGVPAWANQADTVALTGDYNGDGRTDIAFHRPGSTWNSVPVLLANGNGAWTSTNFAAPSWANQHGTVALTGDFNQDDLTDIAFHKPGSTWATVPVLFATGNGGWTDTNLAAPSWANQPGVVALTGDYNRDGFTDIAFHRPGSTWATVPVLFANGNGAWTDTNLGAPSWANQPSVIAVGGTRLVSSTRAVDASGDDSAATVYRSGAMRVSYSFASPPSGTISSIVVEGVISGVTRTLATYTSNLAWSATRLVNLANVSNLAAGVYTVRVRVHLTNGTSALSPNTSVTVLAGATASGTFAGETFTVQTANGNGQVFRGLGGTDTLNLHVAASTIASVNGMSFAAFVSSRSTGQQAIYRGSAYDFVRFTNGREVYFQGFERIQVTGAVHEIAVRPNDPEFVNQWNLHTTDVPGAWRFTTGASNVLLVSLDSGLLVPAGASANRAIRDQDLTRMVTDSTDDDQVTTYGHGHASISVMSGATNNGQGVAGVNWNATVFVADVYSGVTLQAAITDALNFARARGMRVVFQGGI